MFFTEQKIQFTVTKLSGLWFEKSLAARKEAEQFLSNRNNNVHEIYSDIKTNSYKFSDLNIRKIPKSNGTHRTIYTANFRDSIILTLIHSHLQDVFENILPDSSIAFRKGKNLSGKAIKAAHYFSIGKYPGQKAIKLDIKDFYNNIKPQVLLEYLENSIVDKHVLNLLKELFSSYNFLPQGLSPMNILANIYMFKLDYVFEKLGRYFRYADDIFLIMKENNVEENLKVIEGEISKMDLEMNMDKFAIIKPGEEFEYLGYVFVDKEILIREKSITKFKNKIINTISKKKYLNLNKRNFDKDLLESLLDDINKYLDKSSNKSWLKNYLNITSVHQLKDLDNWIKKRLRNKLTGSWSLKSIKIFSNEFFVEYGLKNLVNEYFQYQDILKIRTKNINYFIKISELYKILQDLTYRGKSTDWENFKNNSRKNLLNIQEEILKDKYTWSEFNLSYNKFSKPILSLTPRDRIVSKIVANYLSSRFNIKKVGLICILSEIVDIFKSRDYKYVLRFDIKNFSDNVDVDYLYNEVLHQKNDNISDRLVKEFLKKTKSLTNGLPRGNAMTSILSEIYLKNIDAAMSSLKCRVIRYADDLIIFSNLSPANLINTISVTLKNFNLSLNDSKTEIYPTTNEINFLGYNFNLSSNPILISISKFHFDRIKRRIKRVCKKKKYIEPEIDWLNKVIKSLNQILNSSSFYSTISYYAKVNNFGQLAMLDEYIKNRIRIGYFGRNRKSDSSKLNDSMLKSLGLKSVVNEVHKRKEIMYNHYMSKIS